MRFEDGACRLCEKRIQVFSDDGALRSDDALCRCAGSPQRYGGGQTHRLEGVTVTEQRRQKITRSTTPYHLLEREQFLRLGVTDVADALHRIPGITLRDYGGAGGMKTVSVRGFGARHTGVTYDGVMLSDCQSGEIDISRYSLDNVSELALTVGDNDDIFIPAKQASTPSTLSIQTLRLPSGDSRGHVTAQMKLGSFGLASPFVRYEQSVKAAGWRSRWRGNIRMRRMIIRSR